MRPLRRSALARAAPCRAVPPCRVCVYMCPHTITHVYTYTYTYMPPSGSSGPPIIDLSSDPRSCAPTPRSHHRPPLPTLALDILARAPPHSSLLPLSIWHLRYQSRFGFTLTSPRSQQLQGGEALESLAALPSDSDVEVVHECGPPPQTAVETPQPFTYKEDAQGFQNTGGGEE